MGCDVRLVESRARLCSEGGAVVELEGAAAAEDGNEVLDNGLETEIVR